MSDIIKSNILLLDVENTLIESFFKPTTLINNIFTIRKFISENNTVDLHQDDRIVIRDMGLGLNEVVIGLITYYKMEQEYINQILSSNFTR